MHQCRSSKGEQQICAILNKYNIIYKQENTFNDCKYKNKLKFDFWLPEYHTCIEYNGEHHYKDEFLSSNTNSYYIPKLDIIQLRDKIKYKYCIDSNIKLIIIKYTDINNIESILMKELNINVKSE